VKFAPNPSSARKLYGGSSSNQEVDLMSHRHSAFEEMIGIQSENKSPKTDVGYFGPRASDFNLPYSKDAEGGANSGQVHHMAKQALVHRSSIADTESVNEIAKIALQQRKSLSKMGSSYQLQTDIASPIALSSFRRLKDPIAGRSSFTSSGSSDAEGHPTNPNNNNPIEAVEHKLSLPHFKLKHLLSHLQDNSSEKEINGSLLEIVTNCAEIIGCEKVDLLIVNEITNSLTPISQAVNVKSRMFQEMSDTSLEETTNNYLNHALGANRIDITEGE